MSLLKRITIAFSLFMSVIILYMALTFTSYNYLAEAENNSTVYLGGIPVGIDLKCNGVIVEKVNFVYTDVGRASLKNFIKPRDNIVALDETEIQSGDDIVRYLSENNGGSTILSINRDGELINVEVSPLKEALSGKYRLGIEVKENIVGVGTLTFYRADGSFGCLGHPICDEKGNCFPIKGGKIYNCRVTGVIKGEKGVPGEIRAVFTSSKLGNIVKNNKFGVYGTFDRVTEGTEIQVASRSEVVPGKAMIYTTVNDHADYYEAEIIKTVYQNQMDDKGLVIRITDSRLLKTTGGVIQGMSGSPIIQNDKLVGAVTHVFVNDPTKGYGTYIDWMLEN